MGRMFVEEDVDNSYRIAQGDESAFDAFYKKHWQFVYDSAFKRLDDREAAQDITQEVFSQFWQQHQANRVREIENMRAYLFVAVRNQVLKWIERERKYIPISDSLSQLQTHAGGPDSAMLFNELYTAYHKVVELLSPQQRLIFKLRYDEGLSSHEIADELQISDKTVRNQLGRALGKVKAVFFCWYLLMTLLMEIPWQS